MLFNSPEFLVFLAIVLALYYSLSLRWQNRMLVVASYVFYGWWDWRFLGLLAISTFTDYACGLALGKTNSPPRRRLCLLISVFVNLGLLGFFKYFGFFVDSFTGLMQAIGLPASTPILSIVLPVGISFYTFQTMAYTIEIYFRRTAPTRDFVSFSLYVAFFPQLVAGPIEQPAELISQIERRRRVDRDAIATGFTLILMGYFKKVAIADAVSPHVDRAFSNSAALSSADLLLSLYLFAIQIYCDFSGYTDIARGVAKLLGIDLRINFKQPYLSANVTEFWRRWHMSLSTWLRDYLYIPLGGNRRGNARTYRNLMITMLLGGLWHGASWNFVAWGGLHGLYLAVHKLMTRSRKIGFGSAPRGMRAWAIYLIKTTLTFHLICLAWIFFRSRDFSTAWGYLIGIASSGGLASNDLVLYAGVYGCFVLFLDIPCWKNDRQLVTQPSWPAWLRGLIYAAMISIISFLGASNAEPFIYFRF